MVSRNSALALTVMLLVSASSQASWLPSMPSLPSLPSFSLPSFVNKENGKFVAAVAASLVVIDLTKKAAAKLWATSVHYTPACVKEHVAKAHAKVVSYVPAGLQSAPVAPQVCPVQAGLDQVNARVSALDARIANAASGVEVLDSVVFPTEDSRKTAVVFLKAKKEAAAAEANATRKFEADAKRTFDAGSGASASASK